MLCSTCDYRCGRGGQLHQRVYQKRLSFRNLYLTDNSISRIWLQALDVLLLEAEARGVAADGLQEPDCARLITAAFEQGGARTRCAAAAPRMTCRDAQHVSQVGAVHV